MLRGERNTIELIDKCLNHFKANYGAIDECIRLHFCYKTYGSTSGPYGGIGGAAMTSWPTVVIVDIYAGYAAIYLDGLNKIKNVDLADDTKRDKFYKEWII